MSNSGVLKLSEKVLRDYLVTLYGEDLEVSGVWKISEKTEAVSADLKGFGYGFPYLIQFQVNGEVKRVVLATMRSEGFGHDHFSDRAQTLLWQHSAFNKLPKHVQSVDVGAFENLERIISLGECNEFFILTKFEDGKLYHKDLDAIAETGEITDLDEKRCLSLSNYLAKIHEFKHDSPGLYIRHIRELVGHSECIMGLLDSYPPNLGYVSPSFFIDLEQDCVSWRWRLKKNTHRLSQVHGDFHPWNVLFREGTDFTVLDRSRGEYGEPANDVTAMTINFLFYSLQKHGKFEGVFEHLFRLFWDNYLEKTGDSEILSLVQPYYAWRGLVVASPVWYPSLKREIRIKLLNFVKNVLQNEVFDLNDINSYFQSV